MNWDLLHFLRPWWLLALLPFVWLVWRLWQQAQGGSAWRNVVAPELLEHVLMAQTGQQKSGAFWWLGVTGVLLVIALAGPTWERLPQPVFTQQAPVVLALDLSASMDATDVKPSRIQRARYKLTDILNQRQGGQTALLVYAGDAFTVTPLTDDVKTIKSQLEALSTSLLPAQGSNTLAALKLAQNLLQQANMQQGTVLLITDEVREQNIDAAVENLTDAGYQLSILGVGTAAGSPIPVRDGMLKDGAGNIVIAKLAVNPLQKIAQMGKGRYATMSLDESDIKHLRLDKVSGKTITKESDMQADQWQDRGPWLLLPLLILFALVFRRGFIYALFFVVLPLPYSVEASTWDDLWHSKDQQGQKLLQQEKPAQAAEMFNSPDWQATAHYRAAEYEKALVTYQKIAGAEARFNEGNTLAKMNELKQAIAAYEEALSQDKEHADAAFNKKIVEAILEEKKEKDQEGGQGDKQDGQEGEQQENDQQQQGKSSDEQQDKQAESEQQQEGQQGEQEQNPEQTKDQAEQDAESVTEEDKKNWEEKMAEAMEKQQQEEQESQQAQGIEEMPESEEDMATKQWLRRIPDDPAGLLKRKFEYQYRQRGQSDRAAQPW